MALEKIFRTPLLSRYLDRDGVHIEISPKKIAQSALYMALGGLLGSAPVIFMSYPLGLALLCASDRQIPSIFVGQLLAALFVRGSALPLSISSILLFFARLGLSFAAKNNEIAAKFAGEKRFCEPVIVRVAFSAATAFGLGVARLIAGGFLYYDLFGLIFSFISSPLLTAAMATVFTSEEKFKSRADFGRLAIMLAAIGALSGRKLLGFELGYVSALIAALCAAYMKGSAVECGLRGCTVGLLAGFIGSGVSGGAVIGLCGLACGLTRELSRALSAGAVTIVAVVIGGMSNGVGVLTGVLPDTLAAISIFLPFTILGIRPKIPAVGKMADETKSSIIDKRRQSETESRMSALSESLASLSEVLSTLSDRLRRPGILDLKQLSDATFDAHCQNCRANRSDCDGCGRGEGLSALDLRSKVTTELYRSGRLTELPGMGSDCPHACEIIEELNRGVAELTERLIGSDKTEAIALDYELMSRLISEAIGENDEEYAIDAERSENLRKSLGELGISATSAICFGKRRLRAIISGVELVGLRYGSDEIRDIIENILHANLDKPKYRIEDGEVEIEIESRRCLSVETASSTSVKDSESANGDTAVFFDIKDDKCYALIADGMGSGREAAVTSKLSAIFLERLLSGGCTKAIALEMLNGYLRQRRVECSSTVDLAEVDLISGKACFVKCGAASSYILRRGSLYRLESKTLPLGIMPELDAEQIKFELEPNDVIILMSDGIAQALDDGAWLANLLTFEWENDLDKMVEKIIDNASLNNDRDDDMTVVLMRVNECAKE